MNVGSASELAVEDQDYLKEVTVYGSFFNQNQAEGTKQIQDSSLEKTKKKKKGGIAAAITRASPKNARN